ncbi:hypothetical protein ABZS76_32805 [Streptomyces sp. NPDC005562]|uniref:hypothetical protein n=1 Tax=Streptomyces sp. NPDC005562 TaxID=3154890 RepID=UPI0033B3AED6
MTTTAAKIVPTRQEILAALGLPHGSVLATRADMKLSIVKARGIRSVYDARHVDLPAFEALVEEMAGQGDIVERTGAEWVEKYPAFAPAVIPELKYFATARQDHGMDAYRNRMRRKSLERQADEYARGYLVERHRAEYEALVGEFHAEHAKETERTR